MTDEQLSAILSALQSVQLAIQNASAETFSVAPVSLESSQIADLTERLYVVQGLEVILICFVALVAGVGLGNILARWFK